MSQHVTNLQFEEYPAPSIPQKNEGLPLLPPIGHWAPQNGQQPFPEIRKRTALLLDKTNFHLEGLGCQPIREDEYHFALGHALSKGKGRDIISMVNLKGTFFYIWVVLVAGYIPQVWKTHNWDMSISFALWSIIIGLILGAIALVNTHGFIAAEIAGEIIQRRAETLSQPPTNNPL